MHAGDKDMEFELAVLANAIEEGADFTEVRPGARDKYNFLDHGAETS
jgi:hypothetical protein